MHDDSTASGDRRRRHRLRLGPVQETLVIPLYGLAVETAKPRAVIRDETAVRIVDSIDYDFANFDGGPSLLGTVLRAGILDAWTRQFLAGHPGGTVVELACGLSSRFERVASDRCRWLDLDLPEVIELRRRFFAETKRRRMIAASVLDDSWLDVVSANPGPYMFLADGFLSYLSAEQVHRVLQALASRYPDSLFAFDTCGRKMIGSQDRHDSLGKMTARMIWACDEPRSLERLGLQMRESLTLNHAPRPLRARMPHRDRLVLSAAAALNLRDFARYRVNLFRSRSSTRAFREWGPCHRHDPEPARRPGRSGPPAGPAG